MCIMIAVAVAAGTGAVSGQSAEPAIEAVRKATVMVEVLGPAGRSTGTGFFMQDDRTIVTAAHVIENAWTVNVRLASGRMVPIAGVLDTRRDLDLAILAVDGTGMPPVRTGGSDTLALGQRLFAVGCPFGGDIAVTDGLLSAVPRTTMPGRLQISVPVSPGSSGGPLFTEGGEVVGVIVSGMHHAGGENVNFALPIERVVERLEVARKRQPTALSELRWPTLQAASVLGNDEPYEETREDLPPVNGSATAVLHRMSGVEVANRWSREDGAVFTSLLRVGVSRSPVGDTIIERLRVTSVDLDGLVGREVHRTIMRLGGPNRFVTTVDFQPHDGRAQEYSTLLQARGSRYVIRDLRGPNRAGQAPPGVLPPAMADLVAEALVRGGDSAGIFALDPFEERLLPVSLEITGRARRMVPFARPGTGCGESRSVFEREVDVIVGTLNIGLERRPVAVLAMWPHVVLEHEIICVRLPSERPPLTG